MRREDWTGDTSGQHIAALVASRRTPRPASTANANASHGGLLAVKDWPHTGPLAQGQRYPGLRAYAGSLRRRGTHPNEALTLMRARWQDCAQPPATAHEMPWQDAEALLLDVYARYQTGATVPEVDEPAPTSPDGLLAGVPPDTLARLQSDPETLWMVLRRLREQQARACVAEVEACRHPRPEPDSGTLAELLARPPGAEFRIDGLLPAGGRLLVTAQYKAGKTTLIGNLARSLLTGEDFLGRFPVKPLEGRVVVLNYEVTGEQFARWMNDIGVPAERCYVINLRGRRNLLADEHGRRELAEQVRAQNGQVLIVDPFGRAYTGASQNDAAEVTPWLVRLDEVAEQADVSELVLTAHAGWNGERTRGSTALNDWPDVLVTLNRDEGTGQRFIRAEGRDVDVPEDGLSFDPATRRLSLTGSGSRSAAKVKDKQADLVAAIVLAVAHEPGLTVDGLEQSIRNGGACRFQKGDIGRASREAERLGRVRIEPGPRRARLHFLPDSPLPPTPPDSPHGGSG